MSCIIRYSASESVWESTLIGRPSVGRSCVAADVSPWPSAPASMALDAPAAVAGLELPPTHVGGYAVIHGVLPIVAPAFAARFPPSIGIKAPVIQLDASE